MAPVDSAPKLSILSVKRPSDRIWGEARQLRAASMSSVVIDVYDSSTSYQSVVPTPGVFSIYSVSSLQVKVLLVALVTTDLALM